MRWHETLDRFADIVAAWEVLLYEVEGANSRLKLTIVFRDGSTLHMREHIFAGQQRKYAYHWQDSNQQLRVRWDNAPHWPAIHTHPHHKHVQSEDHVEPSDATTLEEVFQIIRAALTTQPM